MASRVQEKFDEWTDGLDTHESMVAIFRHVRDIPYSLGIMNHDPDAAEQILMAKKGSCGPKHYLLADMYRRLGLNVVFATFAFSWNDPDLAYPPALRELAAQVPLSHHLACRVEIGCRWVLVDATWDLPLARAGFPVNEHWDGLSDTKCAVKPLPSPVRTAFCRTATNAPCRAGRPDAFLPLDGEVDHCDPEDHSRYYRGKTSLRTPDEVDRMIRFFGAFDAWLERVRT